MTELDAMTAARTVRQTWEALWNRYCEKLERLHQLKARGRYGYQLRMPKKALRVAAQQLTDFEKQHDIPLTLKD